MDPRWQRLGAVLLVAALIVGGRLWYVHHRSGTFWDDAAIGTCVERMAYGPLHQLMSGRGTPAPRTPTVPCDDPRANYTVISHHLDTPTLDEVTCADGTKDLRMPGRIRATSSNGRGFQHMSAWGVMCAAPVLHPGRCYPVGGDRGGSVAAARDCGFRTWLVTGKIVGTSDIRRCSPATGLVLTEPAGTYCETTAPLPPELRANHLAKYFTTQPPPAG